MNKGKAPFRGTPPTEASSELPTRQDVNIGVQPQTMFGDDNPGAIGPLPSFSELAHGVDARTVAARFKEPSTQPNPGLDQTVARTPREQLGDKYQNLKCDLKMSLESETLGCFWFIKFDNTTDTTENFMHSEEGWTTSKELAINAHKERWGVKAYQSNPEDFEEYVRALRRFSEEFPDVFGTWDRKLEEPRKNMSFNSE